MFDLDSLFEKKNSIKFIYNVTISFFSFLKSPTTYPRIGSHSIGWRNCRGEICWNRAKGKTELNVCGGTAWEKI